MSKGLELIAKADIVRMRESQDPTFNMRAKPEKAKQTLLEENKTQNPTIAPG